MRWTGTIPVRKDGNFLRAVIQDKTDEGLQGRLEPFSIPLGQASYP